MAETNEVIVGYWATRGRAGSIRSLLAYCGIPFKNKGYTNFGEWFGKDKHQLGFEYPNIPYLIDGDTKVTESLAILHYIPIRAGKKELLGNTDDKFIQVEQALGVAYELAYNIMKFIFTKGDVNTEKEEAFTKGAVKAKLEVLNKNLEGKEWLTGFLSIADFYLVELIDMISEMDPVRLEAYPNLLNLQKRMLDLPEIKAHRQSENHIKAWFPPAGEFNKWTNVEKK
jgi:glutathione S-transferase